MIKNFLLAPFKYDLEPRQLFLFIQKFTGGPDAKKKILDVGCGYGRNLRPLKEAGYDVIGVEANSEIVSANLKAGLPTFSSEQITNDSTQFDVILMSHIIEHFSPKILLPFMDGYLDKLKTGGYIIICTPLITPNFYDDFDHVKPYQPTGILMVFGTINSQVQFYSRNKLKLEDLWFRRGHFFIHYARCKYVKSPWRILAYALELCSIILFFGSLKLFGRANGWMGVFKKVKAPC